MPELTFRDRTTDADFASATRIYNAYVDDDPITVEQLTLWASEHPAHTPRVSWLVSEGGVDVAYATAMQAYFFGDPGQFFLRVCLDPVHETAMLAEGVLRHLMSAGRALGAMSMYVLCRSDKTTLLEVTRKLGFVERQRNPGSVLDLPSFDERAFRPVVDCVLSSRIQLVPYDEFVDATPGSLEQLWRVENELMVDVPTPTAIKPVPFETWAPMLEHDRHTWGHMWAALDDGVIVGHTHLHNNLVDSRLYTTGLTGVVRSHRRSGIATALKTVSLVKARENGGRLVSTDNEESNPMYQLNLTMGFRHNHDYIDLAVDLRSATACA